MWPIVREIIKTAIENEQNLIDEIIEHESDLEARLIKEDCTIDDLKQCNRFQFVREEQSNKNVFRPELYRGTEI